MSSPKSSKRKLDSEPTDTGDAKKVKTAEETPEIPAKPETSESKDPETKVETEQTPEDTNPEAKSDKKEVPEEKPVEKAEETTEKEPELRPKATFGGTLFSFNIKKKPAEPEKEPAKAKEATKKSAPVFGATSSFGSSTTFGNKSILDTLKSKPNVFDSLPSKSEEKPGDSKPKSEPVSSGFGSNSKFGNAFQESLKKKSFLDESKEETEEDDSKSTSPAPQQYKQVDLAPVQEIKTGEEDETSIFSVRAKIFELDLTNITEGWKERGVGPLHLNESIKDRDQIRLVMRSQGLLRVVLNMRISSDTVLIKGLEASLSPGKFLRLNSISDKGTPVQYLLKFGNEATRNELYDKVEELKARIKK